LAAAGARRTARGPRPPAIGRSSASSVNDGTQRSVTALITPRPAPRPTRARGRNSSGRDEAETRHHRPVRQHQLQCLDLGWRGPPSRAPVAVRPGGQRGPASVWRVDVGRRLAMAQARGRSALRSAPAASSRTARGDQAARGVRGGDPGPAGNRSERHARRWPRPRLNECPLPKRPYRQARRRPASLTAAEDLGLVARPAPPGPGVAVAVPAQLRQHAPASGRLGGRLGPHYWRVFIFHQRWSTVRACLSTRGRRHAGLVSGPHPGDRPRARYDRAHRRPGPAAGPRRTWARSTGTPPTMDPPGPQAVRSGWRPSRCAAAS